MGREGILVVVSGFSGAGKGTLMKALVKQYDEYALSMSATTRKPREGETHGKEYFFLSREEFQTMIQENALIEYAQYVENYYGTPKAYVQQQMAAGRDVILEIEIQGAMKVKEQYPEALLLFVTPPSAAELKRRLISRGTESPEVIEARLKRAAEEAEYMGDYDYLVINDDLDTCVKEMHALIQAQHSRTSRQGKFIQQIKKELNEL